MSKMNYNRVFAVNELLSVVPLSHEGRTLPQRTTVNLLLLKGAYSRRVAEFESQMQGALRELKADSRFQAFDALAAEVGQSERAAIELQTERLEEYQRMSKELTELYRATRIEAAREEIDSPGSMTAEDYAAVVELIGVEGEIELPRHGEDTEKLRKVSRAALLENIAAMVIE